MERRTERDRLIAQSMATTGNAPVDAEAWAHSFQFQRLIAEHPAEFRLGYVHGESDCGLPLDDGIDAPRSQAYELGRALRRGAWS
jgi:hypothetical protein